jgi:hypothetical protein
MFTEKIKKFFLKGWMFLFVLIFGGRICLAEVRGDVNRDDEINVIDAMLILKNSLGLNMNGTGWQATFTSGDVDCNGRVNTTAALLTLRESLDLPVAGSGYCGNFNDFVRGARLQEQYNDRSYCWADKENSVYYLADETKMSFKILDNSRIRCELRTFLDEEWSLSEVPKIITGRVRIFDIGDDVSTLTFLQLHHKDLVVSRPFVRLAWDKRENLLKAVVRNDDGDGGQNNYFFGELSEGVFFPVKIIVDRDNLQIVMNGREVNVLVPDYWKNQEEFYYKAGLYFGIDSTFYKKGVVEYKELNIYGDF